MKSIHRFIAFILIVIGVVVPCSAQYKEIVPDKDAFVALLPNVLVESFLAIQKNPEESLSVGSVIYVLKAIVEKTSTEFPSHESTQPALAKLSWSREMIETIVKNAVEHGRQQQLQDTEIVSMLAEYKKLLEMVLRYFAVTEGQGCTSLNQATTYYRNTTRIFFQKIELLRDSGYAFQQRWGFSYAQGSNCKLVSGKSEQVQCSTHAEGLQEVQVVVTSLLVVLKSLSEDMPQEILRSSGMAIDATTVFDIENTIGVLTDAQYNALRSVLEKVDEVLGSVISTLSI